MLPATERFSPVARLGCVVGDDAYGRRIPTCGLKDAKKRGYGWLAWVWGAFGLLNVPSSLIIYLLVANAREHDAGGNGRNSSGGPKARPQ